MRELVSYFEVRTKERFLKYLCATKCSGADVTGVIAGREAHVCEPAILIKHHRVEGLSLVSCPTNY